MDQAKNDYIILTPYPVEPNHTLISINRYGSNNFKPELLQNAAHIAKGDNSGIVINRPSNIMDYNKNQNGQKERPQQPSAKMSFKVFLMNSETNRLTLEHRTLRFWISNQQQNDDSINSTRTFANIKQESSHLAQAYFCQLIGDKPNDDFPKNYIAFIMKLMRLLKREQFNRIVKMEVELRQKPYEDNVKPPSRASSIDGGSQISESGGAGNSPLTSQKVLDIIESSYPKPISVKEICTTTHTEEIIVRQFVKELAIKEKINSTDDDQHFTRTTKPIDTKINLVKQMPNVIKAKQPVIAIITAQYCEKLAVDSMISDKETFVRYRTTIAGQNDDSASANYVYTLGNIGDHRVVSTKLTTIGHSMGALIAAGSVTTRLLGTFPEIEYVFLVGCGGGVANYTDFSSHVRLGDVVISHLPTIGDLDNNIEELNSSSRQFNGNKSPHDYVYVHCRPKQQKQTDKQKEGGSIPVSYSIHKNLKKVADEETPVPTNNKQAEQEEPTESKKLLEYSDCHFRLWRPAQLDLQELAQRLWLQGADNNKHRIWEYYIDEGIKNLKQQDIDAIRPANDTDKLFMSINSKETIEVSHPEAGDDELDLRKEGRPMCHFGPIGSGRPAMVNEPLKQRMISEFGLKAFDSEFDPVVESIYGNCKESYIMIRGISDYKDGRKKKEWQQYSALVAAAFMKSIIVNLKPLN